MPVRHATAGTPCWVELASADTAVTVPFYCELFGWAAEAPNEEFGGYRNFTRAGERVAGCMAATEPGAGPGAWSVYLATDDAAGTLAAAAASGGQVAVPAMAVGDMGTMGIVVTPDGGTVGVWQAGTHPGFTTVAEPGTPSWWELRTPSYDGALAFYRSVFGWETRTVSDTAEFRYSIVVAGDAPNAGVHDASATLPAGAPGAWQVYFGAGDTDERLARAVELGGRVVTPAEDTPYGRMATVADPTGVEFKLVAATLSDGSSVM